MVGSVGHGLADEMVPHAEPKNKAPEQRRCLEVETEVEVVEQVERLVVDEVELLSMEENIQLLDVVVHEVQLLDVVVHEVHGW